MAGSDETPQEEGTRTTQARIARPPDTLARPDEEEATRVLGAEAVAQEDGVAEAEVEVDDPTRVLDLADARERDPSVGGQVLEDAAVTSWALREGVTVGALESALGAFPTATVGEALVLSGILDVIQASELFSDPVSLECPACKVSFQLGAALACMELTCPRCLRPFPGEDDSDGGEGPTNRWTNPPPAVELPGPEEETPSLGIKTKAWRMPAPEAQRKLDDDAFARWASVTGGVPPGELTALRERCEPGGLSEGVVLAGLLDAEQVLHALSDTQNVCCHSCRTRFRQGVALLAHLSGLSCPSCGGTLTLEGLGEAASEAESDEDTKQVARFIGPYRLVKLLGKGGMGEVYAAHDLQGNLVAIKLLATNLKDDTSRRRFEREGRLLEDLSHPNIVGVLGRGVDEKSGSPYLALEYVRGPDLSAVLKSRPERRLQVDEAIYVLERCVRALAHAHERGIIHRDVKPGNVLVTREGLVKLSDFGISLAPDESSVRLTLENTVIGTAYYLAPEVLKGQPWTGAADVYALGAFAFYLLAGRHAFQGDDILSGHLFEEPPALKDVAPDVPAPLAGLVMGLLGKDPTARPTAQQVVEDLARLASVGREQIAARWIRQPVFEEDEGLPQWGDLPRVGQDYHHYHLEDQLAQEAGGVVFRAVHRHLRSRVALKVVPARDEGSEAHRRFLREAELSGSLKHPNIVRVLDCGTHAGTSFISMELIEGRTLDELYQQEDDLAALLGVFTRICDGVHYAHTRGVLHRDLKPDNVLVDAEGQPRILDFGLAKRLDTDSELTAQGDVLGTLRYMAPEQARGAVDQVDVRSDVYALGGILYELVTRGKTALAGVVGRQELLRSLLEDEPPPPSQVVARPVPRELDAICLRALARERDDRYQSALELKQDVERFLSGLPVLAQDGGAYRLEKWVARRWRELSLVTLLLLLGISLARLGGGVRAAVVGDANWNPPADRRAYTLVPGEIGSSWEGARGSLLIDMDRDGDLDALVYGVASSGAGRLSYRPGDGAGHLGKERWGVSPSVAAQTVASADLDRNGVLDLVVGGRAGLEVWRAEGAGLECRQTLLGAFERLLIGDLDRDGVADVLALKEGNALAVFPGRAAGGLGPPRRVEAPPGVRDLVLTDWNRDGRPDLLLAVASRRLLLLSGDGRGGFSESGSVALAAGVGLPACMAVGDLDLDGWDDVLVGGEGGLVQVFRGSRVAPFLVAETTCAAAPVGARIVRLVDLDRDGDLDLLVGSSAGVLVVPNQAPDAFHLVAQQARVILSESTLSLAVGDLNRDGDADVLVVTEGGGLRLLLGE